MSSASDLQLLAMKVRALYWAARADFMHAAQGVPYSGGAPVAAARWDGGTDRNGTRHRPIWPKIAAHLARLGVTPEAAVRTIFRSTAYGNSPPLPNALLSQDLAGRVTERSAKDHRQALARVAAEKVAVECRLARLQQTTSKSPREIYRQVILDPGLSVGPLVRLCLARQSGQHDLEPDLLDDAFLQYAGCPEGYEKALGESLPAEFRQRLRGVRTLP